jgi:hypothetical protein
MVARSGTASKQAEAPSDTRLSARLEAWLERDEPKTIGALTDLIDDRSFALVLMLLLFPSAIPVPTGGVTHVLELIAVLVTLQIIVGRRELWLPQRVREHELGKTITGKAVPAIVRRVRWFERWARPRLAELLDKRTARTVLGVFLLLFVTGALLAPPFSGLDTLPSLGVVIMCLGLIFSDMLIVSLGMAAGTAGIALVVALGSATWSLL